MIALGTQPGDNERLVAAFQEGTRDEASVIGELWERNKALVHQYAWKYKRRMPGNFDYDDLIQEGYFALRDAARRIDLSRGFKFTTVLVYALRGRFGYLQAARGLIRISCNPGHEGDKDRARQIQALMGINPSLVAHDVGISRWETEEDVNSLVGKLRGRDAGIVREVMSGRNMSEIAREQGISKQMVNFIYHRAIRKLRAMVEG
jgi:RNA polymerase sigma factor (sigma-70 family)